MLKNLFIPIFMMLSLTASAADLSLFGGSNASYGSNLTQEPLSVEEAFPIEIDKTKDGFSFIFDVKPNHYLYKEKLKLKINGIETDLNLPNGSWIHDEFFGDVEVFKYGIFSDVNYSKNDEYFDIEISYQGCFKEQGICYPPSKKIMTFQNDEYITNEQNPVLEDKQLNLNNVNFERDKENKETIKSEIDLNNKENNKVETFIEKDKKVFSASDLATTNNVENIVNFIQENKTSPFIFITFVLIGLFVAFTPCIYPLMPIIVASTSGTNKPKTASAAYVLGIILAYFSIGLIVGLLDFNIQILFQNKWFSIGVTTFLILAALYLMGFFNLMFPNKINDKLTGIINNINPNKIQNQVIIGYLSSLLLSPCAIAPLLGVLIFINQMGEPIFGGLLLASMGLGIGIPLFLLTTSFSHFMPKNGAWMNMLKEILGYIMIALGIYISSDLISKDVYYVLLSGLVFIFGLNLINIDKKTKVGIFLMSFSMLFALNQIIDEKSPIVEKENTQLNYTKINNLNEYKNAIEKTNKPIFIDFYADWCITCVRLENNVLNKENIKKYLNNNFLVLKIDLSEISKEEQELMDELKILAIPYYVFMDSNKKESIYTGDLSYEDFFNILKVNKEAK